MKRVKSYNQFRESRPIKEEFINKLSRWITGADAKEIGVNNQSVEISLIKV